MDADTQVLRHGGVRLACRGKDRHLALASGQPVEIRHPVGAIHDQPGDEQAFEMGAGLRKFLLSASQVVAEPTDGHRQRVERRQPIGGVRRVDDGGRHEHG